MLSDRERFHFFSHRPPCVHLDIVLLLVGCANYSKQRMAMSHSLCAIAPTNH
jgi:hypothetical protein